MGKMKKIVAVVLGATMLFGSAIAVHAASAGCPTCGKTAEKKFYISQCSNCIAPMYMYQCPLGTPGSFYHPQFAMCDNGHIFY